MPKGSVIYFSGVPNVCTREDIKESLSKFDADIAFIDFQRGHTEGWVRLQGKDSAKTLLEKTDEGKVSKVLLLKFVGLCFYIPCKKIVVFNFLLKYPSKN